MGAEYLQLHSSCSHVAVPHHHLCAMGVVSRDVVSFITVVPCSIYISALPFLSYGEGI